MPTNSTESTMRIDYSDEWFPDFQRRTSLLKQCVSSRGIVRAKTVTFDKVAVSGRADTRLRDSRIPASRPDTSQVTKDLAEHHKKYQVDDWDLFRNNSEYRSMMQADALAVVNREVDHQILEELDTTTNDFDGTTAITGSTISAFLSIIRALRELDVPSDGMLWGVITPALEMQMMRINQFLSTDYVEVKPAVDGAKPVGMYRRWLGVNWLVHQSLSGMGGALAKNYIFHETAVAHKDDGAPSFVAGSNDEDDYAWCRARVRHCAKVVTPEGCLRFYHDDNAAYA